MKRQLLLLLLLVIVGGGGYLYLNKDVFFAGPPPVVKQQPSPEEPAKKTKISLLPSIFPASPVIWVHLKELGKQYNRIKKSNFYKQAIEYKIFDPSQPLSVNFSQLSKKKRFSKFSSQLEENFLIDFLGQEIGLALYPPNKKGASHFIFAAKISAVTKTQEKIKRLKDTLLGGSATVSEKKYNEKNIITYLSQDKKSSFHYIIFKDHFIGSSDEDLLKKGIDLMEGKGSDPFIQSEEFNSLFKRPDLARVGLIFVDIERMVPDISTYMALSQKESPGKVENTRKQLEPLKSLGLTFSVQKGLEIKSTLLVNTKAADQKVRQITSLPPRELKSLGFIPGNSVVYGANIYDPIYFYEQFTRGFEAAGKKKKSKSLNDFLKKSVGVELKKEMIPFLGNEFFYSASAPEKDSPFPIPEITIGLEIKDEKKIEALLSKIETSITKSFQQKAFKKEIFKGYTVKSVPTPMGVQPGYSIVNNFLVLSVNKAGIKRLIDVSKGKIPPLKKNKKYLAANIPAKNNGVAFVNTAALWNSLREVATKSGAGNLPASSQGSRENGLKALDLLQVVNSFDTVIMFEKDRVNSKSFFALNDIPKVKKRQELVALLKKSEQKKLSSLKAPPVEVLTKPLKTQVLYTYNPTGKRDPFKSLLEGRKLKKARRGRFIEDIKSLEPINLYIYKKVKKQDPALYKKLRDHARFFKNKKAVKKLSDEERSQKLETYKQLISIARTGFHDIIQGPLQGGYPTLKLSAIIWGEMGSIAMIETPDGRGHIIRKKDLVGPNYGSVEKIDKNKIVIVEQYVNYVGVIKKKNQEIVLPKKEGSI